jgi:ParB family chromosome partitioning protein
MIGRKFTIKSDKISRYFSDGYTNEDIEKVIISLLEKWKEGGGI